jgi:hypothetical protein
MTYMVASNAVGSLTEQSIAEVVALLKEAHPVVSFEVKAWEKINVEHVRIELDLGPTQSGYKRTLLISFDRNMGSEKPPGSCL